MYPPTNSRICVRRKKLYEHNILFINIRLTDILILALHKLFLMLKRSDLQKNIYICERLIQFTKTLQISFQAYAAYFA
jgi:hypothetical protein